MTAVTFEQLARDVLDSFAGAWMVPYPREGGAVERFYDLFVPSGMGGMVALWAKGDCCTVRPMGCGAEPIRSDDVEPQEGANRLRTAVEEIVGQPRPAWVDWPSTRAFVATHLTREAVTARCLERGEPAPVFRDPDADTHEQYVDQAAWRRLSDLRRAADEQREVAR